MTNMNTKSLCLFMLYIVVAITVTKTTIEAADEVLFMLPSDSVPRCVLSVNDIVPANASLYLRFNNVRLTKDADITDLDLHITSVVSNNIGSEAFLVNIVREVDPVSTSCSTSRDVEYNSWNYADIGINARRIASSIETENDWDLPNSALEIVVGKSSWNDLRSAIVMIVRPDSPSSIPDNAYWDVNPRPYIDISWTEAFSSSRGVSITTFIGPIIFGIIIFLIALWFVYKRCGCNGSTVTTTKTTTHTTVSPQINTTPVYQTQPQPQQPVAYGTPMQPYTSPQPYGVQPGYPPQGQPYPPQGQPIAQGYPVEGQPYSPQVQDDSVAPVEESPYAEDSPYQ